MSHDFFNTQNYLSSREAGKLLGYTHDYISRLCRDKKMSGVQHGRVWYVTREELVRFQTSHEVELQKKNEELSKKFSQTRRAYDSNTIPPVNVYSDASVKHSKKHLLSNIAFALIAVFCAATSYVCAEPFVAELKNSTDSVATSFSFLENMTLQDSVDITASVTDGVDTLINQNVSLVDQTAQTYSFVPYLADGYAALGQSAVLLSQKTYELLIDISDGYLTLYVLQGEVAYSSLKDIHSLGASVLRGYEIVGESFVRGTYNVIDAYSDFFKNNVISSLGYFSKNVGDNINSIASTGYDVFQNSTSVIKNTFSFNFDSEKSVALSFGFIKDAAHTSLCFIKDIFGGSCQNPTQPSLEIEIPSSIKIIENSNATERNSPDINNSPVQILQEVGPVTNNTSNGISMNGFQTRLAELQLYLEERINAALALNQRRSVVSIDRIYEDSSENIRDAIEEIDTLSQDEITILNNVINQTTSGTSTFEGAVAINNTLTIQGNSGSPGQVLTSTGTSSPPIWSTIIAGGGDSNTLDTLDSTQFLRSDNSDSFTSGTLTFDAGTSVIVNGSTQLQDLTMFGDTITDFTGTGLTTSGGALSVTGLTTSEFASNAISQWTNDSGYLASILGLNISDLNNDTGYLTGISGLNISELNNDIGYITSYSEIDTLQNVTSRGAITTTQSSFSGGLLTNLGTITTPSYSFIGDTNTGMWSPAPDTLAFSEGGIEVMRINSSGNVGIGTTTPATKLHLEGNFGTAGGQGMRIRNTNASGYTEMVFVNDTDNVNGDFVFGYGGTTALGVPNQAYFSNRNATPLSFWTDNTQRMTIDGTGNLGIGTVTPALSLHILRNASNAALMRLQNSAGSGYSSFELYDSNGVFAGSLGYGNSGASVYSSRFFINGATGVPIVLGINNFEGARLHTNGNFGIGATAPASKLVVNGNVGSGDLQVGVSLNNQATNGYSVFRIGTDTASPVGLGLHQFNSGFIGTGAYTPLTTTLTAFESGGLKLHANHASGAIRFYTGGNATSNERMAITSAGNVGIGTASPSFLLDVNGTARVSQLNLAGFTTWNITQGVDPLANANSFLVRNGTNTIWSSTPNGDILFGGSSAFLGVIDRSGGASRSMGFYANQNTANIWSTFLSRNLLSIGTDNGRVSIGINNYGYNGNTAVSSKLTVLGEGTTSSTSALNVLNSSSGSLLFIRDDGNVGIGTTTPTDRLVVAGNLNITGAFETNGDAGVLGSVLQSTGTGTQWVATSTLGISGGASQWTTNGANINYVSGSVSVGTTTPRAALHVATSTGNILFDSHTPGYGTLSFQNTMSSASYALAGNTTNTFLNAPLSGTLRLGIGNANHTTLNATGMGIFNTSPRAALDVYGDIVLGSNTTAGIVSRDNVGGNGYRNMNFVGNDFNWFSATSNQGNGSALRMIIKNTTGNIGMGNEFPVSRLDLRQSNDTFVGGIVQRRSGTDDAFALLVGSDNSLYIGSAVSASGADAAGDFSTRFLVTQAGNIGIGTTTPSQRLVVAGNAQFTGVGSGAYGFDLNLTSDGTLTTSASDMRLKENIVSLNATTTLEKILLLNPSAFDWKSNGAHDIGLIAQEVETIFPELVFTNNTDGYKGINYSRVPALLISGVQALSGQISDLYNGVANLFVGSVRVKNEICIDDVCVNKEQLQQLLQDQSSIQNSSSDNTTDEYIAPSDTAPVGDSGDVESDTEQTPDTGTSPIGEGTGTTEDTPVPDDSPVQNENTESSESQSSASPEAGSDSSESSPE